MKAYLAAACFVMISSVYAVGAERCSVGEIESDKVWTQKICDTRGFRKTPERSVLRAPASSTRSAVEVTPWLSKMRQHERLAMKAAQIGDTAELRRQSASARQRLADVLKWPEDDIWAYARVYCAQRAQELANFADDKGKRSARAEVAADASWKAYQAAGEECAAGLAKLK